MLQNLYFLSVTVSFDPITYTVTEGKDDVVNISLVRSGDLTRTIVVTVTTVAGTDIGMQVSFTQLFMNVHDH